MEAPGFTLLIILMQNLTINMLFDAEIPWTIWAPVAAAATPRRTVCESGSETRGVRNVLRCGCIYAILLLLTIIILSNQPNSTFLSISSEWEKESHFDFMALSATSKQTLMMDLKIVCVQQQNHHAVDSLNVSITFTSGRKIACIPIHTQRKAWTQTHIK